MRKNRVLIIVQNMPVPLDRRVWLECQTLRDSGVGVSVICPKGPGDGWHAKLDDVHLYKYPPPPAVNGLAGYAFEFAYCWLMTAVLSIVVKIRHGFAGIQACNPPDTYWLLALLWRPFGTRFVYDQHDLNPEVYLSRFGKPRGLAGRAQLAVLYWLERMTYRTAQHVMSTNESYRRIAQERGGRAPESVTVVRSGPNTSTMRPVQPRPELRQGADHLAVYLGIMGPQDGVDLAIRAFHELVEMRGRTFCHFALLGFGDCLEDLKQLADELKLNDLVTFTGRVGPDQIANYLSSADVGIGPDPASPLNDVSTMNKVMEYMAYCLPIVSFDLAETRVSAKDAAVYVPSPDLAAFAGAWSALLDDPEERLWRGLLGRERVTDQLDWRAQAPHYVAAWRSVLGLPALPSGRLDPAVSSARGETTAVDGGKIYIDLTNPAELSHFVRVREPR